MVNEERAKQAIAEIRQQLRISSVLRQEGVSRPPVRGLMTCLFHPDSKPSLSIDDEQGLFYCFSCGRKGDVIKLFQECESVLHNRRRNYYETVEYLIRNNEAVMNALGFSTIIQEDTKEFKLPRTDKGEIVWSFGKQKRAESTDTLTLQRLGRRVRSDFLKSNRGDGDIAKVMTFISCCELGYPVEDIVGALNSTQNSPQRLPVMKMDEDVLKDLSFLLD